MLFVQGLEVCYNAHFHNTGCCLFKRLGIFVKLSQYIRRFYEAF